jgi:predicted Zn-dependent protease
MAADAILHAAEIHLAAGRLDETRESLEFLLFSTKSPDAEAKALQMLAVAYERMGDMKRAEERLDALARRYPNSAPGIRLLKERAGKTEREQGAGGGAGKGAGGAEAK